MTYAEEICPTPRMLTIVRVANGWMATPPQRGDCRDHRETNVFEDAEDLADYVRSWAVVTIREEYESDQ